MIVKARCWKFGDNIPSDLITPITIIFKGYDYIAQHVLERVRPEFPKEMKKGDIIVAGKNWACSSGRTTAPKGLRIAGVGLVIAESFSRTFFRNASEVGLPILECPGVTAKINDADVLEVEVTTGVIKNLTTGETIQATPPPPFQIELIKHGGLLKYLEEKGLPTNV